MRIFFDFTSLQVHPCGISVYLSNLYQEMLKLDAQLELTTGYNTIRHESRDNVREIVRKLVSPSVRCCFHAFPGRIHIQRLPFLKSLFSYHSNDYDVVHFPSHICSTWTPFDSMDNSVLTVHDMFAFHPELFPAETDPFREAILQNLPEQAQKTARIITVSEFSKREICKFLSVPSEKVVVIPLATQWNAISSDDVSMPSSFGNDMDLWKQGFFLGVGALFKHKNWGMLLKAYRQYRGRCGGKAIPLVIVGRPAEEAILHEITCHDGVVHLSRASEGELKWLYKHAKGFFLPSRMEGFGIPLLEAMECGCPACYAKGSAMDEIGRDAAWGIEADDIDGFANIFERFADDGGEVAARAMKGLQIAKDYTWKKTAEQTLSLFAEVAKSDK